MKQDNVETSIDDILDEINKLKFNTLSDKVKHDFDTHYTSFKEQFVTVTSIDSKKEMIDATYGMSLESLNNALMYLEYSYSLILSIQQAIKDFNLTFSGDKAEAMMISNNYIEKLANNIDLSITEDLSELLLKLKENTHGNA